jgi:hypothetical protein
MSQRRSLVAALDRACGVVDAVAYRPAVVKLTSRLPRWWRCELARLSVWLDDRWSTGYWADGGAPEGLCDACGRRAAWLVVGGRDWMEDIERDHSFMEGHPVHLCGYCNLPPDPIETQAQLAAALASARDHSIAWRWRTRR